MIIASIDTRTGDTVLIGIPRNLERVPIPKDNPLIKIWPNGYDCGDKCLINALWVEAEDHKELFVGDPNPGLTTIRGVLEEVLGIRIDYTVIADLAGFRQLVDAMGGVEINVVEDIAIYGPPPNYPITSWIRAGRQTLDGYHALWYARSRVYSKGSDFDRMKRQRCVVNAFLKQANPGNLLRRYPEIAGAVKENVSTDIPVGALSDWADLVLKVQKASVRSLALTPDNISVVRPDFAAIRRMVADALTAPTSTPTGTTTSPSNTPSGTATSKPTSSPSTSVDPGTAVDLGAAC
jgi:LCP family protein required for cell wall assembly